MAVNYEVDEDNVLRKMVMRVMKDHERFRILTKLRFLFVWRLGKPEYDKEGLVIFGMVKRTSSRERDLYKKDIELRVFQSAWEKMSDKQRYRLVYHELSHVSVEVDEGMNVKGDDDGRVLFSLLPHDVLIRTFQEELDRFGLPAEYVRTVESLTQKRQP